MQLWHVMIGRRACGVHLVLGRLICLFSPQVSLCLLMCGFADATRYYMTKKAVKHAKETLGKLSS